MSLKAQSAGSACPPLKEEALRLYSMRFCPYAERTRLVLAHLNIPHEVINVNLNQKPDWFLVKNPLGTVPVLEKGKRIVYDSPICNEYLDGVYGKHALLSTDPYEKAQQKMLLERFSKVISPFYGTLRHSGTERQHSADDLQKALDVFEQLLVADFFGKESVRMVDFFLWPWFERFPMLQQLTGIEILPVSRFPKLNAWVTRMKEVPAVKTALVPTDLHLKFINSGYLTGDTPDYDVGLA